MGLIHTTDSGFRRETGQFFGVYLQIPKKRVGFIIQNCSVIQIRVRPLWGVVMCRDINGGIGNIDGDIPAIEIQPEISVVLSG